MGIERGIKKKQSETGKEVSQVRFAVFYHACSHCGCGEPPCRLSKTWMLLSIKSVYYV